LNDSPLARLSKITETSLHANLKFVLELNRFGILNFAGDMADEDRRWESLTLFCAPKPAEPADILQNQICWSKPTGKVPVTRLKLPSSVY
jgi:hypothetical protein